MSNQNKRNPREIIIEILKNINRNKKGILRTHLYSSANLGNGVSNNYMNLIKKNNLIEERDVKIRYRKDRLPKNRHKPRLFLTERGKRFLSEYERLNSEIIKLEESYLVK